MKTNRLFEIIYLLLNRKTATAKELAEHFGVSQRTIYRDVDTLSLTGVPVYTEKGKGGGISLLPGFVLNKSILSEQEQNEILSALHGLSAVKTADTEDVLRKLSTVFNKSAANWLEVDFTDWSYQNGDVFQQLKTAILDKRIAEFDYFNSNGEKSHRKAEPIQLWFKSKAWYLRAFCLVKNDMRIFKITRIRNIKVTDEIFPERDLLKSIVTNAPITENRPDTILVLNVAAERAYRVYDEFDGSDVTHNADGSFTVTVTWPEDEWVYATILSYGEYITVLEPEHIKVIIKEKANKIAMKY
ncbi:transcriptional regulator [Clostridia bacterium]|nr:transcriptional regulator [Clostridia bacterium]